MTHSQGAAYIAAMTECAAAERAGMEAQNKHNAELGISPLYCKSDFDALIDKYGIHHNAVMTVFQQSTDRE